MYSVLYLESVGHCPDTAGIISFKKMSQGYMPFGFKVAGSKTAEPQINHEIIEQFKLVLVELLTRIFDPNIPILEQET